MPAPRPRPWGFLDAVWLPSKEARVETSTLDRYRWAVRRHIVPQLAEAAFVGDAWRDTGLVFTTALGGWIDPNNFARVMDVLTE